MKIMHMDMLEVEEIPKTMNMIGATRLDREICEQIQTFFSSPRTSGSRPCEASDDRHWRADYIYKNSIQYPLTEVCKSSMILLLKPL